MLTIPWSRQNRTPAEIGVARPSLTTNRDDLSRPRSGCDVHTPPPWLAAPESNRLQLSTPPCGRCCAWGKPATATIGWLLLLRCMRLPALRFNQINQRHMTLVRFGVRRIRDNVSEILLERFHAHVHVFRRFLNAHDLLVQSPLLPVREVLHGLQLVVVDNEPEHLLLQELVRGQILVK